MYINATSSLARTTLVAKQRAPRSIIDGLHKNTTHHGAGTRFALAAQLVFNIDWTVRTAAADAYNAVYPNNK